MFGFVDQKAKKKPANYDRNTTFFSPTKAYIPNSPLQYKGNHNFHDAFAKLMIGKCAFFTASKNLFEEDNGNGYKDFARKK